MSQKIFRTPKDLLNAYRSGFIGAYCDPEILERLLFSLPHPTFDTAGIRLRGSGKGKLSLPFKSVYRVGSMIEPYLEAQTTGDCVSHGTRNAADVSRAVQIDIRRNLESFITVGATEAIYGSRGHGGQGMSCGGAAEFISKDGGLLLRQNYPNVIDFTNYNSDIGSRWGSRGVPNEVKTLAREHQVKEVTQIRTIEQARDALANGYAISVCSNQGFSSKRDSKGFARPQGNWSHCMAWVGCDDTGSEPAFIIVNSWGSNWISGPKPEYGIPDGAFLCDANTAADMLRSDESFAFSSVVGWPPTKLPDYGFDY